MMVMGLAGSLRRNSHNVLLLRAAAAEVPPGTTIKVWRGLATIPPYDEDLDTPVALEPVARLRAALAEADALLISTPEYNASIPGQLKNARLGFAPVPRERITGQAGRRHRRQHEPVRGGLGAGRAA